jgi:hypothetical protein
VQRVHGKTLETHADQVRTRFLQIVHIDVVEEEGNVSNLQYGML